MVAALSWRETILAMILEFDTKTAEASTNQTPGPMSTMPGRTTIRQPATASAMPSQRRGPTRSPRKTIASSEMHTGPSRLTAVASQTGHRTRDENQHTKIGREARREREGQTTYI